MPELWYYAHAFTRGGTATESERRDNLLRATSRALELQSFRPERIIWAPWINMGLAGVSEEKAWPVIEACILASTGIVIDLDGTLEAEHGLAREVAFAEEHGIPVVRWGIF